MAPKVKLKPFRRIKLLFQHTVSFEAFAGLVRRMQIGEKGGGFLLTNSTKNAKVDVMKCAAKILY